MTDAQRYRMNAIERLSAPKGCGSASRDLTLAIAASWLALARHEDAMDGLLATWKQSAMVGPSIRLPSELRAPVPVLAYMEHSSC
jgi:hypothetical protein